MVVAVCGVEGLEIAENVLGRTLLVEHEEQVGYV